MEKRIKKYLSDCSKETLIELYLQMRFERDLYCCMYEELKSIDYGSAKGWTLDDRKVRFGYDIAKKELENREDVYSNEID